MNQDALDRIAELEQEVRLLRHEVNGLKAAQQSQTQITTSPQTHATTQERSTQPKNLQHISQLNKQTPTHQDQKNQPQPEKPAQSQAKPQKQKRSIEQMIITALPKIFMIILVLGVLWGLKLVSDYGYLSDIVKILLGFTLSIALAAGAYIMEKKAVGSTTIAIVLYAGAFIVGILTTAAGAILYEALALAIALVITLLYIAYGIAISYIKGNEALTSLVILTSLLLPYLLEYMEFDASLIMGFVLLLFIAAQVVILKHKQRIALYIGVAFSIIATLALANSETVGLVFGLNIVLIYAVFLFSYLKLYASIEKHANKHAAILFSISMFAVLAVNLVTHDLTQTRIVLLTALAVTLFYMCLAWKRKAAHIIDVLLTVVLVIIVSLVLSFNLSFNIQLLALLLTAFSGLILGMRLRASFMKVTYAIAFTVISIIVVAEIDLNPFIGLSNVTYLIFVAMLITLYRLMKRPVEVKTRLEKLMAHVKAAELMPVLIFVAIINYVYKIDYEFLADYYNPNMTVLFILAAFTAVVLLRAGRLGRFLPYAAAIAYVMVYFILLLDTWVAPSEEWIGLVTRVLYIGVGIMLVVDLWNKGQVYRNFEKTLTKFHEILVVVGMIGSLIGFFGLTDYLTYYEFVDWKAAVILNTVAIFIVAILALLAAPKYEWKKMRGFGFILLFVGILKLIFFDLAALDLLIRSILFIGIGGIGLLLSNRLLSKK